MEAPKKDRKSPWIIIYPIYLNDRKTVDQGLSFSSYKPRVDFHCSGRKVPLKNAGTNPTCQQIVEACKQLGLQTELEVSGHLIALHIFFPSLSQILSSNF